MWAHGAPRFLLRDSVTGIESPSREPTRGATLSVDRGIASVGPGARELGDVAVQGYPALVIDGVAQAVADSDRERRVALVDVDGQRVALVAGYGTMRELVAAVVRRRPRGAIYLDGGRAAHLASGGETVYRFSPSERPISWVLLR